MSMSPLPSETIQKYYEPLEASRNRCRIVINLTHYPYPLPKIKYKGKRYVEKKTFASASASNLDEDFAKLTFDPLNWKKQDHYAMLNLSKERSDATEADIKKAYRKMILKYHPDKKRITSSTSLASETALGSGSGSGSSSSPSLVANGGGEDDNHFKCIQKAWEVLSDPEKRRQYDSIDPSFDEKIPSPPSAKSLAERPAIFFESYRPAFEMNARFSKIKPVPELGDMKSTREEVEAFYEFWYNFDSRRSFEYLDEEDTETAENRMDKRYLDKKNKTARSKRKTDDNIRLRTLVDQATECDPRLKLFREQDRLEKDRRKNEKRLAEERSLREAQLKADEERRLKEEKERVEKERAAEEKRQREAHRSVVRCERRAIKTLFKDREYFMGPTKDLKIFEHRIVTLDAVVEKLTLPQLIEFKGIIETLIAQEKICGILDMLERASSGTLAFQGIVLPDVASPPSGAPDSLEARAPAQQAKEANALHVESANKEASQEWTPLELQCLIKAANQIPGGSRQRWEKIAEYVSLHSTQPLRTTDNVIKKSKDLKEGKQVSEEELQKAVTKKKAQQEPRPWSKEEQTQLETALRKYPASASISASDRWDSIAKQVPTRSKKECVLRFKQIALAVQSKKLTVNGTSEKKE